MWIMQLELCIIIIPGGEVAVARAAAVVDDGVDSGTLSGAIMIKVFMKLSME